MYCSRCGQKVPDDALFCEHCGNRIERPITEKEVQSSQKSYAARKPHGSGKSRAAVLCLGLALLCVLGIGGAFLFLHGNEDGNSEQLALPAESRQEADTESTALSTESVREADTESTAIPAESAQEAAAESTAMPVERSDDTTERIQAPTADIRDAANAFQNENVSSQTWVEAYAETLEDFVRTDAASKFQLADLDGNGIPELIVAESALQFEGANIYTYRQSEVAALGTIGSSGAFSYNPQTGIILSSSSGMGTSRDVFYRLTDGSLELLCEMENYQDFSSETYRRYTIDQEEVSEDEYDSKYNSLAGTGTFVSIGYDTGWTVTTEAITSMIRDYTLFLQTFNDTNDTVSNTVNAFSPDVLPAIALDYYERHYGRAPSYAEIERMEDGMYMIHLYDIVEDDAGGHTVTCAWYEVNEAGVGMDTVLMTEVDLTS